MCDKAYKCAGILISFSFAFILFCLFLSFCFFFLMVCGISGISGVSGISGISICIQYLLVRRKET